MHRGETAKNALKTTAAILFWIAVWYFLYLLVHQEILLPSPVHVAKRLTELLRTKDFYIETALSLARILAGFFAGVAAGTLIAAATVFCKPLYSLLKPVITLVKTTPVASFILLALVWIKRGGVPSFISFLMVLPIIWANVSKGLAEASPELMEVAKVFRFPVVKRIKDIYIPSAKPYFYAGCTTASGLAWKAGIAAEVISTPDFAIGTHLYNSKIYLETTDLFAWTVAVVILSVIIERLLKLALNKLRG